MKPEEIKRRIDEVKAKRLTKLDLSNEWDTPDEETLTEIPSEVFELEWLEKLDLSNNQINEISETLTSLSDLYELYLSYNGIKEIPETLTRLSNLSQLDLRYNGIKEIPETIGNLSNLSELYLSNNQIKEIPGTLSSLSKLSRLYLSNNPLETPPLEIAEQGIEAIREYFHERQEEGEDTLYEAKLIIVGEGETGKNTLMKKILNPAYKDDN
ncbi:leucine-rich repeat domain-containing protein [Crocosphaera sp. XPORK-15E]|uniref:leucine-rich repeat domain-containing protein n=1 Tax=Crocosphaera sp. XPORK-15E TaxID=3110247 RepID=UPI002B1FF59C|nr:leucine-rich repeat domain-containing protein [Crocosphaera sp. XPORK-15E]MEA5532798.1 leucine-rich repeat domain-containing protein [Crocosphaera sp. XPORK-15E]